MFRRLQVHLAACEPGDFFRQSEGSGRAVAFALAGCGTSRGSGMAPLGRRRSRSRCFSQRDCGTTAGPGSPRRFTRRPVLSSSSEIEARRLGQPRRCIARDEKCQGTIRPFGSAEPGPVRGRHLMSELTSEPAIPNPESRGAFDPHHPPSSDLIDKCVHCGFCLATCPTYALWGEEMDSPRGRIYLMKHGLKETGQVQLDPTFVNHMDNCLGCMACLPACPSGVQFDKLIEATRAQIERNYPRPMAERILRRMMFELFPRPERLRWLLGPMRLYQRSGLQSLVRRSGLLKLFPSSLVAMDALMPSQPSRNNTNGVLPERVEAQGERRLRVGLLLGCVQSVFFPEVNAATARVLAAEGCEVVIPKDQCCCGALMTHVGEEKAALDYARRTIDAFERAQVDEVVINAAGCGSNMKDYGYLLREDTKYAERAK